VAQYEGSASGIFRYLVTFFPNKDAVILLNQICTLDKQRLIEHWGRLSSETMTKL